MKKKLLIVESPAKTKTLRKFLSSDYRIESSVGHIIDLPGKGLAIDLEHDFTPQYAPLPDKKEVIEKLKQSIKGCDELILATDPDREGEAIAWHILSIFPKGFPYRRVTFNAITKDAVLEGLKTGRKIDEDLVNAQQARRILDRLVGYRLSPILMRKVMASSSLSAGRVQSVALKLVVDREEAIETFVPIEYWNMGLLLEAQKPFKAHLFSIDGVKTEKSISTKEQADAIDNELQLLSYQVTSIEKKERLRSPPPPFITSTLQQEAFRHFGFSSSRTMSVAQALYEGVDLGQEGSTGLITYMRTDSPRVAPEALAELRQWIQKKFGKEFCPKTANYYASKKGSQEAHEAIRPTSLRDPEELAGFLTPDQQKLYRLIYRRFIASQMSSAIYDTVTAWVQGGEKFLFKATGSTLRFPGFLALYEEKSDEEKEEEGILPLLEEGRYYPLIKTYKEQAFTKPLPRFTEASLVKEMEKLGIGRPSTYSAVMNKIQGRHYTTKEKGSLKPTELGRVCAKLLESSFAQVMDVSFTALMEADLDAIAEGSLDYKQFLSQFWTVFEPLVKSAEVSAHVPRVKIEKECPNCGKHLLKIWSKGHYFIGCEGYPECSYREKEQELNRDDYRSDFDWDQRCSKCGSAMIARFGKFGPFLGCEAYPKCKSIISIPKKDEADPKNLPPCPAIGCEGTVVQRRSRYGKTFFSCSTYPACDVVGNDLLEVEKKYKNRPKTAYQKGPKSKSGVSGGKSLSKELAELLGEEKLSRPEVTKRIWDYIKKEKLQNPKDRREIVPDERLAKVTGKEPFSMMLLARKLSPHFN